MNLRRLFSKSLGVVFSLGTIASLGCSDLPDLALNACGNYVIDVDEDCDLHADAGFTCARAGEVNECHYVCFAPTYACPPGYGCGQNGVCRRATGTFVKAAEVEGYNWPRSLQVGDFDSDGNGDLLLTGQTDSSGYRASRVLFSNGFSLQDGLEVLPTELANPAIGAGTESDVKRDIAFADFDGIALLRGYSDRTADFTVFPTLALPRSAKARIVMTDALISRPGDELFALVSTFGGAHTLSVFEIDKPPMKLTSVSRGAEHLASRRGMTVARFDESRACAQIVLSFQWAEAVEMYTPCINANTWNINGTRTVVKLQPPAQIDHGAINFDLNSDGHLDLVIGAGGRTYVAYGLGNGHFVAKQPNGAIDEAAPYDLPFAAQGPFGFPLAMADLNVDGRVDFVTPGGIAISDGMDHYLAYDNIGASWSEAVIASFNANELPDVVTVIDSTLDLHFLNNAGNGVFGMATLPTEGIPTKLATGDFDGDLLADVVFSEAIAEHGEVSDHLSFAFGKPFGPLEPPVATGEVGKLGQIVTGNLRTQAGEDPMTEVGVLLRGESGAADSIALLPGRASRAIFSMLPLRTGMDSHIPISLAFGRFGDDTADIVALGTHTADGRLRLFRIEAADEEGLDVPLASDPLPPNFIPWDNSDTFNLRYGAKVVAGDIDGNGTDEAIVVGSFADPNQCGLALAKYEVKAGRFAIIGATVFPGQCTTDSRVSIEDVDGDGKNDIVLTTGTSTNPEDLLIIWGNGSDKLPNLNQYMEHVRPNGEGVRAVASIRGRTDRDKSKMLVLSTPKMTYLYELQPDHSWKKNEIGEMGSVRAFGVVDFDRDGVEDLAVQSEEGLELFYSIPK